MYEKPTDLKLLLLNFLYKGISIWTVDLCLSPEKDVINHFIFKALIFWEKVKVCWDLHWTNRLRNQRSIEMKGSNYNDTFNFITKKQRSKVNRWFQRSCYHYGIQLEIPPFPSLSLKKQVDRWTGEEKIGHHFKMLAQQTRIYAQYLGNYPKESVHAEHKIE